MNEGLARLASEGYCPSAVFIVLSLGLFVLTAYVGTENTDVGNAAVWLLLHEHGPKMQASGENPSFRCDKRPARLLFIGSFDPSGMIRSMIGEDEDAQA